MRADLIADVGMALATAGAALQWLRAQKRIPDTFVVPLGVIVAATVWALAVDWKAVGDVQAFVLHSVPEVGTLVCSLFGGTFMTSKAANAAVAKGLNPEHPLVPKTSSK